MKSKHNIGMYLSRLCVCMKVSIKDTFVVNICETKQLKLKTVAIPCHMQYVPDDVVQLGSTVILEILSCDGQNIQNRLP